MGERRIDHEQVKLMRVHLPPSEVAKRLDISPRSVRRIARTPNPSIPSPDEEFFLMKMYRDDYGLSFAQIGRRFGKTRQAVQQAFEREGVSGKVLGVSGGGAS